MPLILVLHSRAGNATFAASRGLSEQAERHGFIAVYPNGREIRQNAGTHERGWNIYGAEDVRFIAQLLDVLVAKYSIDEAYTFVAGLSNGGGMAYRPACDLSGRIAAIAVAAGSFAPARCEPGRPILVLHIHGTDDLVIPYAGGAAMIAFWRTHNGCTAEPVTSMVTALLDKQASGACRNGTEVTLCSIKGGGHCWPGPPLCSLDDADEPFDTFSVIVAFLLAHPRSGP